MDRPMVGVGVIIRHRNRVLIGKRLCKHANGLYGFPGGHMEMFESFAQCARREMVEEVGSSIQTTEPEFWTVANTMFREENKHYIVPFVVCDYISGVIENAEPDKCEGWEWASWFNLPRPLMPGIISLLNRNMNPFNKDNIYYANT